MKQYKIQNLSRAQRRALTRFITNGKKPILASVWCEHVQHNTSQFLLRQGYTERVASYSRRSRGETEYRCLSTLARLHDLVYCDLEPVR